jgi:hypothetical protein
MHLRNGQRIPRPTNVVAIALVTSALLLCAQFSGAGASTASDKAQAKKALLVLADMPSGWKTEKGSTSNGTSNFPGAKQLAGCIGVSSKLINSNPPKVDSPYFQNKSGSLEVQDSVSIFASAKVAQAKLGLMANTKSPSCMTTVMNGAFKTKVAASAGKGATLGTITVTRANPANFAKGATGLIISIPITDQGQSVNADIEAVYYIKGARGHEIDFYSYDAPFPASISKTLASTAFNRL